MKIFLAIVAFFLAIFVLASFELGMGNFFKPKFRALDSKVFKESEQYSDGMVRDLENFMYDHKTADTEEKKRAIKALVRHRFSVYPKDKLSGEQISFLNE